MDIPIVGDKLEMVPDGVYTAKFLHHETHLTFNTPKVYLRFSVLDPGVHFQKELVRPYRAKALIGASGFKGKFSLARRSELYLALCKFNSSRSMRPDRISLIGLKSVLIKITTRTVTTDYRQRKLPLCEHYSVVDSFEALEQEVCYAKAAQPVT